MELIWRQSALSDLAAIRDFIATDNPEKGGRVRTAIAELIELLVEFPDLGRAGRVDGTRELPVRKLPYIVAYRVVERQIRILAVIHTSRQWPERF